MKVIILAAGRGTRISKRIGDIPKSMVDVGGEPLLKHTVNMLKTHVKESDISIVVGYKRECIQNAFCDTAINFFVNPFYPITNSICSLWFALEQAKDGEDLLVCNADVFWSEEIYAKLMADNRDAVMLSDVTKVQTGDYFFKEREDKSIVKYGKELPIEERSSEYLGIAKIGGGFVKRFKDRLERMLKEEEFDKWWENVLYSFVNEEKIFSLDVDGKFWAEVDYIEDYERILDYVGANNG